MPTLVRGYNSSVEKERSHESGFSVIEVTAILAVLVLIGSALWQSQAKIDTQKKNLTYEQQSAPESTDSLEDDPLAQALADVTAAGKPGTIGTAVMNQMLNSYLVSKNNGTYSPEYAAALGSSLAPMIQNTLAYQTFSEKNLVINPDTSEKASVAYQKALYDALAPLRTNTAPEFEFFALYVQTKDPVHLVRLQSVATLYRDAVANAAVLFVPSDVAQRHVAILNAMGEFAAALDALALHADDPIESVALLRDYNAGEQHVLAAFNALQSYYATKYAKRS